MPFQRPQGLFKTAMMVCTLAGLSACGTAEEPVDDGQDNIARAPLAGPDGTPYGEVIAAEGEGGLIIQIRAEGMTEGPRGVHIHSVGQCEGPDFKSAGGHWNPMEKEHGLENPAGAHMGDFPNLNIGEDGTGALESIVDGATLQEGDSALLDADGAAFIIHAGPDDMMTDPSGDSGGRVACGVFALQKYDVAQ